MNDNTKTTIMDGSDKNQNGAPTPPPIPNLERQDAREVIGVLISRSNSQKPEGEYWPIRMGTNLIGRDSQCDVVLQEKHVSAEHAKLMARYNREHGKLELNMVDVGSNGILVDGKDPGPFNPVSCQNMSRIFIGEYEMILMFLDPAEMGLNFNEKFVPLTSTLTRMNTADRTQVSESISYD